MSDIRLDELSDWMNQYLRPKAIEPISGDASFRRYFRVKTDDGTFIAADAPPKHENTHAFVNIAQAFAKRGLKVPEILQVDVDRGYLLLTDFGDVQLLSIINSNNADQYYLQAFTQIACLQSCVELPNGSLPLYNACLLNEELTRFHEWFLLKLLGIDLRGPHWEMLNDCYRLLVEAATVQPQVCVHRDFHSRNLMVLSDGSLGILDFQDAAIGPITYDLVSLLRDCYIAWPHGQVYAWVERYWQLMTHRKELSTIPLSLVIEWFDWMGLQRHLKVLGTFARLYKRDRKLKYLQDIPRVYSYVLAVCRKYPEFTDLWDFLVKLQRILAKSFGGSC